MKRKPVVGISSCLDEGVIHRPLAAYVYVNHSYVAAIERAAAVPIVLPVGGGAGALELIDALLIPGGDDIHPRHYGQTIRAPMKLESERRIAFDRSLLQGALDRHIPILAVCYGMQLLNVHLGGTLVQRLPTEPLDHGMPGGSCLHPVSVSSGALLASVYGGLTSIETASSHRQAVATLGQGLVASAVAPDGVVEAIELAGGAHVLGVEWHPESSPLGERLFDALVRWANERRA